MGRVRAGLLVLAVSLAAPSPSRAQLALPPPDAWRPLTLPKVRRRTVYTTATVDGVRGVRAESECAASALVVPLDRVDTRATPVLRWRWRVERGLEIGNERVKAGDDFAARVYVMFHFDGARATFAQRVRHRIALLLFGTEVPGKAITYVRSSHEPPGATWDSPFTPDSKMISLGPAEPGTWTTEAVDVVADYRRLVGTDPPALMALALMTDADNSCQHAVAYFADFTFVPRAPSDQGGG